MGDLLNRLSRHTGFPERDLRRIMVSAPDRYKRYTIPKRDGTRRPIAQPSQEVKAVQRAMADVVLSELPIHHCATAYRPGVSLADNVRPHANSGPILKMDFKDFFPSMRVQDWISYCAATGCLDTEDAVLSGQLLFFRTPGSRVLRLAIGAPSSPMMSNILMYKFDEIVYNAVKRDKVIYTRYADDMTFSAPRTGYLNGVQKAVSGAVRTIAFPKLDIKKEKTVLATKKYRRVVTGLTISNDERVTVGRDRKRLVSATVHSATLGKLTRSELESLSGMLAFINSVEPGFIAALRTKYGSLAVDRILAVKPRRQGPPDL